MGRTGRGLGVRLESSDSLPSGPMTISAASRGNVSDNLSCVVRCVEQVASMLEHAGGCRGCWNAVLKSWPREVRWVPDLGLVPHGAWTWR